MRIYEWQLNDVNLLSVNFSWYMEEELCGEDR